MNAEKDFQLKVFLNGEEYCIHIENKGFSKTHFEKEWKECNKSEHEAIEKIKEGKKIDYKSLTERFNELKNIKLTIFITYSGIEDEKIEPVNSKIASDSLIMLFKNSVNYKVILYWRPIIPGLNDSDEDLLKIKNLAMHAHAIVFSGLVYRDEISDY